MSGEADIHREVSELRDKVGDLDGTMRVTKHAIANLQMVQSGISARLDKFEERIASKLDLMSDKMVIVNTQQARGAGFFAGMAFAIGVPLAMLLGLAKILFGHGA